MSEYDRLGRLAKELREKYPPGTRLELISMKEEFSPVEEGTRGTVHFIDDIGQIHMLWDNKRTYCRRSIKERGIINGQTTGI